MWKVLIGVAFFSLEGLSSVALGSAGPVELWMRDGQLFSNPVRVHVTRDLSHSAMPRLRLLAGHALLEKHADEDAAFEPIEVVPNQVWTQSSSDGSVVHKSGSVLIFDLSGYPRPWFKSVVRLTPLLEWTQDGAVVKAIAARAINVGNSATAWLTSVLFAAGVVVLFWLAMGTNVFGLLLAADEHLSLSRVQIALWSIAVGTVVFGHGLIQLEVPAIPESIVALMGLSLATGGVANRPGDPASQGVSFNPSGWSGWSFADLIFEGGVASISRAQMLFWTLLMVVLFLTKSVLNGVVWEVPWSMVALMGLSQGSYLAPKLAAPNPTSVRDEMTSTTELDAGVPVRS